MFGHKYKAKATKIDGIKFPSQSEAKMYEYLKCNDIKILELQPKFELQPKCVVNGEHIRNICYIADFKIDIDGDVFYIDVKGMETPVFTLKHKMWKYKYGQDHILFVVKNPKDLEKQVDAFYHIGKNATL